MAEQYVERVINGFSGAYAFLSNFYPAPVIWTISGTTIVVPTTEHAFQGMKTLDMAARVWVFQAPDPGNAKLRGRQVPLRPDWEQIKKKIMFDCVFQKFGHADLARQLIATGNATLIEENSWGDTYWGCVNGRGHNYLGQILMSVRMLLRDDTPPTPPAPPPPAEAPSVEAFFAQPPAPGRGPDLGPWFTAMHESDCAGCGGEIMAGDEIRADGEGGWLCTECGSEAEAERDGPWAIPGHRVSRPSGSSRRARAGASGRPKASNGTGSAAMSSERSTCHAAMASSPTG